MCFRNIDLQIYYPIHSSQTSQIDFTEEVSTGQSVGTIPDGPHNLHRDDMTPPLPLLDCTVLYYNLLYIGVPPDMIDVFIR